MKDHEGREKIDVQPDEVTLNGKPIILPVRDSGKGFISGAGFVWIRLRKSLLRLF